LPTCRDSDRLHKKILWRWREAYAFIEKLPGTPLKERLVEGFLEWRGEIEQRLQVHDGSAVATSAVYPAHTATGPLLPRPDTMLKTPSAAVPPQL
jgi:hypothetical protein